MCATILSAVPRRNLGETPPNSRLGGGGTRYVHGRGRALGGSGYGAVISKSGDVVDLEVLDGPIELAVSAVNAVRQWKYRPYVLNGEPVEGQDSNHGQLCALRRVVALLRTSLFVPVSYSASDPRATDSTISLQSNRQPADD